MIEKDHDLVALLGRLYNSASAIRPLLLRIHAPMTLFVVEGRASDIWPSALIEVYKHGLIEDLIRSVVSDYPKEENDIQELKDRFVNIQIVSGSNGAPVAKTEIKNRKLFLIPPTPSSYIERSDETKRVVRQLLSRSATGRQSVEAIHGLGGIGKSTLAKAVCASGEIQGVFDCILWANLGTQANPLKEATEWIAALTGTKAKPTSISDAIEQLRVLLEGRRLLVVLDDVWHAEDALPLYEFAPATILITTRRVGVAEDLHANTLLLEGMPFDDAIKLLEYWLGRLMNDSERPAAIKLIESIDRLPLALELAGSLLQRNSDWNEVRSAFEAETERLQRSEIQLSRQLAKILACISVSTQELRKENERIWILFSQMAVLPRGVTLLPCFLATLWQTDVQTASTILRQLEDDALVQRFGEGWRMHDLVHDTAIRILGIPAPEGLGTPLAFAHAEYLRKCGWSGELGAKSSIANDGYSAGHLTYHLEMAGEIEAIHELLCQSNEKGKNAWWYKLAQENQMQTFSGDLDRGIRLAYTMQNPFPFLYRYSLIRSSLTSLENSIGPEIVKAMVQRGFWTIEQGFAMSNRVRSRWQTASILSMLLIAASGDAKHRTYDSIYSATIEALNALEADARFDLICNVLAMARVSDRAQLIQMMYDSIPKLSGDPAVRISRVPPDCYDEAIRVKLEDMITLGKKVSLLQDLAKNRHDICDIKKWSWSILTASKRVKNQLNPEHTKYYDTDEPATKERRFFGFKIPHKNSGVSRELVKVEAYVGDADIASTEQNSTTLKEAEEVLSGLSFALANLVADGLLSLEECKGFPSVKNYAKNRLYVNDFTRDACLKDFLLRIDSKEGSHYSLTKLVTIAQMLPENLYDNAKKIARTILIEYWGNAYFEFDPGNSKTIDSVDFLNKLRAIFTAEEVRQIHLEMHQKALSMQGDGGFFLARVANAMKSESASSLNEARNRFIKDKFNFRAKQVMSELIMGLNQESISELLLVYYGQIGDEAEQFAMRLTTSPWSQEQILVELELDNHTARAHKLIRMLQHLAKTLSEPELRDFVESAAKLEADWWIVEALTDVLKGLDDISAIVRIHSAAREIGPPDLRARLSNRVIERLVELGQVQEVTSISNEVEVDMLRWEGLVRTVNDLAANQKFDDALAIADLIIDSEYYSQGLAHVCLHMSKKGDYEKARVIATKIRTQEWMEWTFAHLIPHTPASVAPKKESKVDYSLAKEKASRWKDTIGFLTASEAGWTDLSAMAVGEFTTGDLSRFWNSRMPPSQDRFMDQYREFSRPDLIERMRLLVPVFSNVGDTESLKALDQDTRRICEWWP